MNPVTIKREVLLVEVVRRCSFPECNAKMSIGLTKSDAFDYRGFECTNCERWNDDFLSEQDIPEWWHEFIARSD